MTDKVREELIRLANPGAPDKTAWRIKKIKETVNLTWFMCLALLMLGSCSISTRRYVPDYSMKLIYMKLDIKDILERVKKIEDTLRPGA